jgi:hypothetical protein
MSALALELAVPKVEEAVEPVEVTLIFGEFVWT